MLTLKKVAITGGIASGKSTFCRFLQQLGAIVVDADQIVHDLLGSTQTTVGKQVLQLFGNKIIENGKISREKIAHEVFNDPQKLKALESLLHPYVFSEIDKRFQEQKKGGKSSIFVVEIPLLFETKKEKEYDIVVTIFRDEKKCRESCKKNDFDERTKRLIPLQEKKEKSHFVIENNGSLEDLQKKAKNLMDTLTTNRN